jgi:sporulation protein YlmC with PRC-barrel domain
MEIEYGAEVIDKNGKALGVIDYLIQDAYTGELKKFKVKTAISEADLFFSPEDVLETTADTVKLKTAYAQEEKNG